METEIFTEKFKGFPVLAIWQVENGIKKGKAPIVSFGLKKAKTIIANIEAIQEWIEEQEVVKNFTATTTATVDRTNSNSVRIELNISSTQMENFKKFMQQQNIK